MDNTPSQYAFPVWEQTQYLGPLGPFSVIASEKGLVQVALLHHSPASQEDLTHLSGNALTGQALFQIDEYLQGKRKVFSLPIDWRVFRPFQLKVIKAAIRVPFGQTTTYGDLAKAIGQPKAARAVGGVMSRNPILLIIPCHRVVSSQRRLTGFSAPGGLETKSWLLSLEGHKIEHQKLV